MTRDSDFIGLLQAYLDEYEGPAPMPDEMREAIRAELPSIRQRPAWWPVRRDPTMSNPVRIALAAAAIAVAAVVGINLIRPSVGEPTPTPDPSAIAVGLPAVATDLEAGTYRLSNAEETPRSFTITVPSGWRTDAGFVTKGGTGARGDVYVVSWLVTHAFADTCMRPSPESEGLVEVRTAQQAVDALASQRGHATTGPVNVSLGGLPAQRLIFEVPGDFDASTCVGHVMRLWPDPGPDLSGGNLIRPGDQLTVYVLDIGGDVVVLTSASLEGASTADVNELDQVVASIRFGPEGESVARHWVAAVNEGDADLMASLMAEQIETGDLNVVNLPRADVITSVLDTWCPMIIDSVEPSAARYLMGVTFEDNEGSTCSAGEPGTQGTFVLEVADGHVTRIP